MHRVRTSPIRASTGPARVLARLMRRAVPSLLSGALLSGVLVCVVLFGGATAGSAAAAEPAPSVTTDQGGSVKYYIVGATGTAEREFLFQIAARTLGDGHRYLEIFDLNEGRLQPDGRRLEDPLVLMPGWILILPADAEGPGVIVGPLPIFGSAQATPGSTATAKSFGDGPIRAAAFVIVTVILGVALHLLRRGRRIELPEPARAALHSGLARLPAASRPTRRRSEPAPDAAAPPPASVDGPAARDGSDPRPAAVAAPVQAGPVPAVPVPAAPVPAATPARAAAPPPAPEATAPVDPAAARVETSLRSGQDVMIVSLIGARPEVGTAVAGRGAGPARQGAAVVRLGEEGPDALWVDLAASPDVVTIIGARKGVRRQSADIARQLSRAGVATVTVGHLPGVSGLAGRTVSSLRDLAGGSEPAPLTVVFIDEVAPADVTVLHDLVARRRPRVVPIAVGSGLRSRWSIDVA